MGSRDLVLCWWSPGGLTAPGLSQTRNAKGTCHAVISCFFCQLPSAKAGPTLTRVCDVTGSKVVMVSGSDLDSFVHLTATYRHPSWRPRACSSPLQPLCFCSGSGAGAGGGVHSCQAGTSVGHCDVGEPGKVSHQGEGLG